MAGGKTLMALLGCLCTVAALFHATEGTATDIKISERTCDTLRLEWRCPTAEKQFVITLATSDLKTESQSLDTKADSDQKCSVEFSGLKPLTKYTLTISTSEKGVDAASIEAMTQPSLEMPEIEEVQEGCAHLTLAPLPEDQAKNAEAYLLLVRPLEDAKDYPAVEIKDPNLKSKIEDLVQPPFYLAYEFTQDELTEENGGQIQIGSGSGKKDGKYGVLQDPKLTSGGNYRVVFVVIMNLEGKQTLFAEESCQMLVK